LLNFRDITIEDKGLFDKHFELFRPQESEMNFTNLFMWREYYKYRYTEISDLLCGVASPHDLQPFAFMPVGEINAEAFFKAVRKLKEYFNLNGWQLTFRKITESELVYFKDIIINPNEDIVLDRDDCDYVYNTEDLATLKGKKYDGKRNHINKFKKNHEFEYFTLTREHMEDCYRIMEAWCAERNCEEHLRLFCEKIANIELMSNYEILKCKGAVIKVDGEFEAFTIGEMLNKDTAVIHIEKANSKIDGLYQVINQLFCTNEWKDLKYINREQDLGIEGLRKSKLSYHPVEIVNKYVVTIR